MLASIENLPRPEVKLIGTDGNAFSILGLCQRALRKEGWNKDQVGAFVEEATSGDYDKVLATAMKYLDVT